MRRMQKEENLFSIPINSEYEKSVKMIVGEAIEKEASKVTEYEVVDYIQSLNQNQVEGARQNNRWKDVIVLIVILLKN